MDRSAQAGPIADAPAEIAVAQQEILAEGFRKYARLRVTMADGSTRRQDILRAGAAAAVLPVDLRADALVLIRQVRPAAQLVNGRGNLIEIVAGHLEAGETAVETARRECVEEIGVAPQALVELFTYLTSPGLCDEEITLFLGVVDAARVPQRGGAAAEHEDTEIMVVPIDAALAALSGGAVRNGPLIVALQWLALNRARLREIVASGRAEG